MCSVLLCVCLQKCSVDFLRFHVYFGYKFVSFECLWTLTYIINVLFCIVYAALFGVEIFSVFIFF